MKKLFSNFYKLKKILLSSLVLGSMTSVALVASCIDQTNPNLNKALSVVEPKNKQFKEWGDDSFLQKVNLNDLSYQKQADQVQPEFPSFNKKR
ncbi:hypothetical protein GE118_03330 [Mycoplasma sp. NEAQ87857]|uniref:hypothetical protein n=1 Tax=Mycoplasma sp. NEAQ87857 TaxID=2683967 RepID=UPI0013167B0A|nr:hypothetical protein [Mycoplasma sp. NEAQ87857]QGZ97821.1 hypothetical protein GE118_03330 [Mycoplasma sp. NEAQ87857]